MPFELPICTTLTIMLAFRQLQRNHIEFAALVKTE